MASGRNERAETIRSCVHHVGKSASALETAGGQGPHQVYLSARAAFRAAGLEVVGEDRESGAVRGATPHPARADQQFSGILRIQNERREESARIAAHGGIRNYEPATEILRAAVHSEGAALDADVGVGHKPLGGIVWIDFVVAAIARVHVRPTGIALRAAGRG